MFGCNNSTIASLTWTEAEMIKRMAASAAVQCFSWVVLLSNSLTSEQVHQEKKRKLNIVCIVQNNTSGIAVFNPLIYYYIIVSKLL